MGEYADMALDAGFSSWGDEEPDEYVGSFKRRLPKLKTCRRCGATGLHWRETDDGWRLHKTLGLWEEAEHECKDTSS
ncbi:MAG: hypothetical protein EON90_09900 [Brevundimonas sp.]|nr:MAG: hypothetical protein EON90_09900 [Brevundimonas sp.]